MKITVHQGCSPNSVLDAGGEYLSPVFARGSGASTMKSYIGALKNVSEQTFQCGGNVATSDLGFVVKDSRGVVQCLLKGHALKM